MNSIEAMRKEVKQYIDTADEKVVKMMHAMLEVDAEDDWWGTMPDEVREHLEEAIEQADRGEGSSHEEVKKKYSKWFAK
ncbi:MAG TPA: hypothetical protein VEV83_14645 [Parafilimonas sp.]|nr:hypothetical protein [Parafilimonas sp.]